ncbi:OVARIAN TUMOR DOMAIN-containing deubiquitinating enzyme 6 [Biomphalaria pfeifferi]|uniref:OVARIAN TUMOR DOMAIN-containing deubiquitinating enzyme 6 n=1 Tax=Biomphalaria pfeifferi TaxID=112525 RepID=A0AAD8BAY4_BIOPF|nr:OVARIAN TUMOR DOMAIN-containing deubiquitinating enzyme 6 [Biomphalaria pfeifferi]
MTQEYTFFSTTLEKDGRQLSYVIANGNCFFRAVSASIYGDAAHYASFRTITVQFSTDHQNHFKQFIGGEDVQGQIQSVSENGSWATTCELSCT